MMRSSVVIPTCNRPIKLKLAVESALAALPAESEIIVIDDASEQPATDILAHLADQPVRIIRNDTRSGGGGSPARNKGANIARGRVLFFLDDDDRIQPDYFNKILDDVVENKDVTADFGFCARTFVIKSGTDDLVYKDEKKRLKSGVISPDTPFAIKTFPFSAGFWLTKAAYQGVGPMSEDLKTNSDTDYALRLYASQFGGWYTAAPGVLIDQNDPKSSGEQESVTKRTKRAERAKAFKRIAERNSTALQNHPQIAYYVYSRYIKHAIKSGNANDAWQAVVLPQNKLIRIKLLGLYAVVRIFSK